MAATTLPVTTEPRRPLLLLALLGLAAFLSIFDRTLIISSIPFARNPAALAAALALGLYVWYRREGLPLHNRTQRWMVAFLLYTAGIEVVRGVLTGELHVLRYLQWAQVLVLAIITVDMARDRRSYSIIWGGVVAAALFMAIAALAGVPGYSSAQWGRVGFAGMNVNIQGYFFALATTTVFWWLLTRWPTFGWREVSGLVVLPVLSFALVATGSRGATLAFAVGLVFVLALSLRARNVSAYATLVPVALLVLGLHLASATVLRDRLGATFAGEDFGIRDSLAIHSVELLAARPWFGYGAAYSEVLGDARGMTRAIATHNSYFQVSVTFGLPALLLWAGILLSALHRAWRSWGRDREPLGALMVALLMASIAFGMVNDLGFNKFFWTLVALASQTPLRTATSPVRAPQAWRGPSATVRPAGSLPPVRDMYATSTLANETRTREATVSQVP